MVLKIDDTDYVTQLDYPRPFSDYNPLVRRPYQEVEDHYNTIYFGTSTESEQYICISDSDLLWIIFDKLNNYSLDVSGSSINVNDLLDILELRYSGISQYNNEKEKEKQKMKNKDTNIRKVAASSEFNLSIEYVDNEKGENSYYKVTNHDDEPFAKVETNYRNEVELGATELAIILYDMILRDETMDASVIDDARHLIRNIITNKSNNIAENIVRNIINNYEEKAE